MVDWLDKLDQPSDISGMLLADVSQHEKTVINYPLTFRQAIALSPSRSLSLGETNILLVNIPKIPLPHTTIIHLETY